MIRLYTSEIMPAKTRSAASSFGTGVNQLINTIVALTSPAFLAKSSYGPYILYGVLTAFGRQQPILSLARVTAANAP